MTNAAGRSSGQQPGPSDKPRWSLRLFHEGDEVYLNQLYNDVFHKNRPLDEWKWKFQSNPATTKKIIPLGLIYNRVVGMYPCVINRWKVGDTLCLATQPVETAVQESARDGKLIVALRNLHVEQCETLGIAFALGHPGQSHYKFGKRFLKYYDLCTMQILDRRLNRKFIGQVYWYWRPLQRLERRLNRLRHAVSRKLRRQEKAKDVITIPVTHFDERFDKLWEQASQAHQVLAVRDRQFLEWRYFKNPKGGYVYITAVENDDLVGYLILRRVIENSMQVGMIADVLCRPNRTIVDALLDFTIGWCLETGVDYIRCGALRHTELYQALMRTGFRVKREAWSIVYTYHAVDEKLFQDSTNWYFTLGDFDFDDY
jgi:hypothetical protein